MAEFVTTYEHGTWNAICDRCGFEFKANKIVVEPVTNYRVCIKCCDKRNPQEWLRGQPDNSTPPWTRPDAYVASIWWINNQGDVMLWYNDAFWAFNWE